MDSELLDCWRVKATDMIEGKMVSLIGGLPNEIVEFTADGRYRVDIGGRDPGTSRYGRSEDVELKTLDIWIEGLESLTSKCLYNIDGKQLSICIAGNNGERPSQIIRNDDLLWCVMTLERCKRPKRDTSRRREQRPKSSGLIPDELIDD